MPLPENDELLEQIVERAGESKSVSVDGQKVDKHSLTEQIALDKYLRGERARRNGGLGIRITKLIPPGTD